MLDIVSERPNNARAHSNAGTLPFRQGRLEEAFPHYSDAVRLKPDYPEARCYSCGESSQRRGATWRRHYV